MNNTKTRKPSVVAMLIPVMLAFFVMGFVDLAGTAAIHIQLKFSMSDTAVNLFSSMIFFWFFAISIPAGMLMNKIGRKNTVLISVILSTAAMIIPIINYSIISMVIAFCLLGIGNTFLQVSANPLLSNIVSGDKLASSMTMGQFVKSIAAFIAPPIISYFAAQSADNWLYIFPIYMAVGIIAAIALFVVKIDEGDEKVEVSSFRDTFSILKNKYILFFFIGIMCHVGLDVGILFTIPKTMMAYFGVPAEAAAGPNSIYFASRIVGSLIATLILAKVDNQKFFGFSVLLMLVAVVGAIFTTNQSMFYVCIALFGLGNANIFPVIVSNAMLRMPTKKNEISALMVTGLFGGAIIPPLLGVVTDAFKTQASAWAVLAFTILYLGFVTFRLKGGEQEA